MLWWPVHSPYSAPFHLERQLEPKQRVVTLFFLILIIYAGILGPMKKVSKMNLFYLDQHHHHGGTYLERMIKWNTRENTASKINGLRTGTHLYGSACDQTLRNEVVNKYSFGLVLY